MEDLLLNPNMKPGVIDKKGRAKAMLRRLRWPVIKGKIELLNCTLDRMKCTLTLMLNVTIYAQQVLKGRAQKNWSNGSETSDDRTGETNPPPSL